MTESETFDLIISAMDAARKEQRSSYIVLKLTAENGLAPLGKRAVLEALEEFQRQDGAGIIRLSEINFPERYRDREAVAFYSGGMRIPFETPIKQAPPKENEIHLEIFAGFDNWLAGYRIRTQDDLEKIRPITLAKVLCTVLDIDEKLEASGQPSLRINARFQHTSPFFTIPFIATQYRQDALDYMKNKGIVKWFEIKYIVTKEVDASYINLTIDIPKFLEFKPRVYAVYTAKEQALTPAPASEQASATGQDTDIMYEVKLTPKREVLLNNVQLARLAFGKENDIVFEHLYKNANKSIPIEELNKKLGDEGLRKDLHKIIDNIGFRGNLKAAFFNVSKAAILFRNPLRKKDLEELGIKYLRLPPVGHLFAKMQVALAPWEEPRLSAAGVKGKLCWTTFSGKTRNIIKNPQRRHVMPNPPARTPFDAVAFLREHGLAVHSEDGLSGIEFQTELRQIVEDAFTVGWQAGREASAALAES